MGRMPRNYDFGLAATKIQSWFRYCAVAKLVRLAHQRFDADCRASELKIQSSFPLYHFTTGVDCLYSSGRPLFLPPRTEAAPVSRSVDLRASMEDEISLGYSEADVHVSRSQESLDLSQGESYALWVLGDEERRLEYAIMQRIELLEQRCG